MLIRTSYQDSLKYYRDLTNSLDTAKEEKAIEIAESCKKRDVIGLRIASGIENSNPKK